MTDEKSVVDEAEEGSRNASEDHGAQEDDLDALLSEWDSAEEAETKSESKDVSKDDLKETLGWIKEERQRAAQEQTNKDIGEAVGYIRDAMGGDDSPLGADEIRWMLNGIAGEDGRLRAAWVDRGNNPEGYRRVLKGLAKKFSASFSGKPDKNLTEDREAVRAAVRGASTRSSSDDDDVPDFTGKSDQEYEAWVRQQARKHG